MTNEQLAAFAAFGLLVADLNNHKEMLELFSVEELNQLVEDTEKYLFPLVDDDHDMVTPVVAVLREAIEQQKAKHA
jgi:hypothetical protein